MNFITEKFDAFLKQHAVGDNTVVAIKGVGTLFGFLKVKEVVDNLAPVVPGRILVFFQAAMRIIITGCSTDMTIGTILLFP